MTGFVVQGHIYVFVNFEMNPKKNDCYITVVYC